MRKSSLGRDASVDVAADPQAEASTTSPQVAI